MFSEDGLLIDIEILKNRISSAEIFVLGFRGLSKRLSTKLPIKCRILNR